MVAMVTALIVAGTTSGASAAAYATMHNVTVDPFTADHCWWIFWHERSRSPKGAEGCRLHHEVQKTDVWLWSDEVLGTWVREASKKVVPAVHTPTTSELKSCLQTCWKEEGGTELDVETRVIDLSSHTCLTGSKQFISWTRNT